MSTRCELDFRVQVEAEADFFGVGRDLWGGMCRAERSLFQAFRFEYQNCRRKHQQRSGD
jgi:hypothetical protein